MESSIGHPLQGLTDAITIAEYTITARPKVVLSWAPHIKALPHAVGNSFIQAMQKMDVEFVITNPEGYDLNPEITKNTPIFHNQSVALKEADFVYAKNWSRKNNILVNECKSNCRNTSSCYQEGGLALYILSPARSFLEFDGRTIKTKSCFV